MKKIVISASSVLVLSLALSNNAKAQTFGVAPEVGMNLSNVIGDNSDNNDMKVGYKIGVNVNMPLTDKLYFSPGLHYSVKGYQSEMNIPVIGNYTFKYNPGYLEVPLNVMYRTSVGAGAFFLSAGPYVAFGIAGNSSLNDKETEKIKWGSDIGQVNPIDIGFNAGLGYELPMGLYIRAQYGHGLTPISNVKNVTQNNQNIQLSLGYNLWTWAR